MALVSLAGCASTPTTTGPLGELDFRGEQPSGVSIPPDAPTKSYEVKTVICSVDDTHLGAEITVKYQVHEAGGQAYITRAAFEVTRPADALEIVLPPSPKGLLGGKSLTPGAPWIGVATVALKCRRKELRASYDGTTFVQFDATGKLLDARP